MELYYSISVGIIVHFAFRRFPFFPFYCNVKVLLVIRRCYLPAAFHNAHTILAKNKMKKREKSSNTELRFPVKTIRWDDEGWKKTQTKQSQETVRKMFAASKIPLSCMAHDVQRTSAYFVIVTYTAIGQINDSLYDKEPFNWLFKMKLSTIYTYCCQLFGLVKFAIHLFHSTIISSSETEKWNHFELNFMLPFLCMVFFFFTCSNFLVLYVLQRCWFLSLSFVVWVSLEIATENTIATIGLVSLPINSSESYLLTRTNHLRWNNYGRVCVANTPTKSAENETTWSVNIKGNVNEYCTPNKSREKWNAQMDFECDSSFIAIDSAEHLDAERV